MKSIALVAITAYQRYVSPHKGFRCAYRVHTGHASCSALGYRAIRMHGVWSGIAILRRRFARCADALHAMHAAPVGVAKQRGFCDLSCDLPGCDLPSLDCFGDALDVIGCCDFPGDCGGDRKRKKTDEPVMVDVSPGRWSDDA